MAGVIFGIRRLLPVALLASCSLNHLNEKIVADNGMKQVKISNGLVLA